MLELNLSLFEAAMLLCFAVSWPFSIAKSIRTKKVTGKSPVFMMTVMLGYIFGMLHKILYSLDAVMFLYIFNFFIISVDLMLYFRYRKN